ncbi:16S rRNA (cytidine(1402)-2'-O)-methyltransferase [Stackebrandtia nassauensis]|uniref:Ribosomal RNA small subunit methyltransferase I n=1 Tax=Stackebrandtia nassauensis (strain DSM 44728 / CIP 108903 / NRRL B-16338 / NBRC 102104 / LLR-40K-21) TaxID=446470 RepID=D3QAX2_STANL|nr:16S rRNA (cytidine(1402)-2'-O)-methyltransferase [Stackebrandtia nassauensis]ADD44768.1 Uroporphyrin-III C/tetrapyrrole (Corrin/Porphyrin) methyltransferase [Stackebrandtia nassauensis DSM 44728]
MSHTDSPGKLLLIGAPLGNTEDASVRLGRELSAADVIAAEDTRRLRRLADELGLDISGAVTSYFEGNEKQRTPQLLERLKTGATVALITDGGMPSVSDPGFRLVRAAVDAGIPVTSVPGPSAVTTALAISGLPSDRFCFEGFLPRKDGERRTRLTELADERRTLVFFESPRRIDASLDALAEAFGGDRAAVLCRELTKTYEEIRRGGLAELAAGAREDPPRGEITLVVAGANPTRATDAASLAAAVRVLVDDGVDRKEALKRVAVDHGVPKRDVYDAVLAERSTDRPI